MAEIELGEGIPMEYADPETGEILHGLWVPANRTHVRYYYKHSKETILRLLNNSSDRNMRLLAYLIKKMQPSDNLVVGSFAKIAKESGLPDPTVSRGMAFLQKHDIIRMVQNGLWMINPEFNIKGYESKFVRLYRQYCDLTPKREKSKKEEGDSNDD